MPLIKIRQRAASDWFADVFDFHARMGLTIHRRPQLPKPVTERFRRNLIQEECEEYMTASVAGDLTELADAIADLIYVALGAAISHGIDIRQVWTYVHQANMMKEGGATRIDGKILKPKSWEHPDIAKILLGQTSIF